MESFEYQLNSGQNLFIREALAEDAAQLLEFVNLVGRESDYLSFGSGEFNLSLSDEQKFLKKCYSSKNQLFILGFIDEQIIATLHFDGGERPRIQHAGEFGMSVAKKYWGLGIGSHMLDTLINWAKKTDIIRKINLRVRTDNTRAVHLYLRKGFKQEGLLRKEVYLNGKYYDYYWMGLFLK
jgi:RimJ/RimL family protein N-acetyltransferase